MLQALKCRYRAQGPWGPCCSPVPGAAASGSGVPWGPCHCTQLVRGGLGGLPEPARQVGPLPGPDPVLALDRAVCCSQQPVFVWMTVARSPLHQHILGFFFPASPLPLRTTPFARACVCVPFTPSNLRNSLGRARPAIALLLRCARAAVFRLHDPSREFAFALLLRWCSWSRHHHLRFSFATWETRDPRKSGRPTPSPPSGSTIDAPIVATLSPAYQRPSPAGSLLPVPIRRLS